MDAVTVVIRYQANSETVDEALRELRQLVDTVVEREADCISIDILQNADERSSILLYERWTSREAYLGDHMTTSYIQEFRLRAPRLFDGPPQITFWELIK